MKEYLKMADEFHSINEADFESDLEFELHATSFFGASGDDCVSAKYAAHAVKHHDALVEENEKLRELLAKCLPYIKDQSDWGNELEVKLINEINQALGVTNDPTAEQ